MRTGGKLALTVREACLAAGLTFLFGLVHAEDSLRIAIDPESVSIKASNTSIRNVLEELSRQSKLVVISQDALDDLVTVDIDEATLAEAIRRLLRQKSFMLQQLSHATAYNIPVDSPYIRLWILSPGSNDGAHSWTTGTRPTNDSELIHYQILALSDDSRDRREAMVGFADIGGDIHISYLQHGLSDPDTRVRKEAIESVIEIGGEESLRALSTVLNDSDVGLRIAAVDAVGEIGGQEAIALLRLALNDSNDTVRETAAEWLTELAWER